ncbi:hypothetical protein CDN99_25620 [Roseateles aquatilis]|uniref:Uncharacterized protein n=1 Tax=Roseateles aquatilis TaxID=431061 RepID=A0A246IV04_9BURK|nr:hypothetical protein [Roseateles aquatilis]OWQ83847.1 hypothetical protein CDN99_25620 [Roseateles aquatilis]
MLNRLPTPVQCPQLSQILDDLGRPAPRLLAKALGVTPATVTRWIREDSAPRPVLLSLFWLTRWGMSLVDAEAVNSAQMHASMAAMLRAEVERLQHELARVIAAGDFGCANDPTTATLPRQSAVVVPFTPMRA